MRLFKGEKPSVVNKIDSAEGNSAVAACLESFSAEITKQEEFRRSLEESDALYSVEQKKQPKFYLSVDIGKVCNLQQLHRVRACLCSCSCLFTDKSKYCGHVRRDIWNGFEHWRTAISAARIGRCFLRFFIPAPCLSSAILSCSS